MAEFLAFVIIIKLFLLIFWGPPIVVILLIVKHSKRSKKKKNNQAIKTTITKQSNSSLEPQWQIDERNKACVQLIIRIENALLDAKSLFASPQSFIEPSAESAWKNRNKSILTDPTLNDIQNYISATNYQKLCIKQNELSNLAHSFRQQIAKHNEHAASLKIQLAYSIIGKVEGKNLDQQQMTCIVKDLHNQLVIAGAGTGKTTIIIGKIKYLLKTNKCQPKDILALSFTNASATEMYERLLSETEQKIDALTFHKLGLNIISKVDGVVPKITQLNLRKFIKDQLALNMQSDTYLNCLGSYLLYNHTIAKSEFEFGTQEEYNDYLKLNPPTTINNEIVKSYGEMDIANFLMQNGINYIYEQPYEIDTRTSEYGQYYPDFYLPDYGIYIEYFGINKIGNVPPYFKGKNNMTANEAYHSSMEWKRTLHKDNKTTLIECYAYEKFENKLLDSLKKKLEESEVVFEQLSSQDLWKKISNKNNDLLDGIIELFETMINLIKSNNYTLETVRRLNNAGNNTSANNALIGLLEPIYNAYCEHLSNHKEIDFNDMINLATKYVVDGKYSNPYKYVIIDEYQDISQARYKLLDCLRKSNDYELFCVGDDWQSIYRFAGSDIGFILNFSKYWGATETSKIETTYRFPQKLIEISSNFIMQNPVQIKKSIQGKNDSIGFPLGEICGYSEKFAIEFMIQKLMDIPMNSSVYFIGRYSFDVKILEESKLLSSQYNNITGIIDIKLTSRPDLKIAFLTAHKSKGLQADYIFIINNKKSKMGFPSKIQDAPILNLLLDNCDQYPYAEERRLFYVALTRAKKKAYLVTIDGKESEFAKELKERYEKELKKERFECPHCGGQLIKHNGRYGEFFGCSNYRTTGCNYTRNIR